MDPGTTCLVLLSGSPLKEPRTYGDLRRVPGSIFIVVAIGRRRVRDPGECKSPVIDLWLAFVQRVTVGRVINDLITGCELIQFSACGGVLASWDTDQCRTISVSSERDRCCNRSPMRPLAKVRKSGRSSLPLLFCCY